MEADSSDECSKEPKGYKGNEFVTDALRHSKVKLTWDQDDPNRAKVTRRALTREEIEEEDFGNLVAASSDEDDGEDDEEAEQGGAASEEGEKKKSKKEKAKERKEKLRALLMSGGDTADIWGKAGAAWQDELADIRAGKTKGKKEDKKKADEVEITFKPALTTAAPVDEENLTSLERYKMRQKEKKARKKEKMELKAAEKDEGVAGGDDFFGDDESDDAEEPVSAPKAKGKADKKGKKEKDAKAKPKARSPSPAPADTAAATLVEDPTHHFDIKDLLTAEKNEGKKRKRHRKKAKDGKELELGPDGFAASVDVADPRFAAIYDEPAFAIDPTHSKFTDTSVNREILKRARDKHAEGRERGVKSTEEGGEKGLSELVESVKAKAGGRARKRSRKH